MEKQDIVPEEGIRHSQLPISEHNDVHRHPRILAPLRLSLVPQQRRHRRCTRWTDYLYVYPSLQAPRNPLHLRKLQHTSPANGISGLSIQFTHARTVID